MWRWMCAMMTCVRVLCWASFASPDTMHCVWVWCTKRLNYFHFGSQCVRIAHLWIEARACKFVARQVRVTFVHQVTEIKTSENRLIGIRHLISICSKLTSYSWSSAKFWLYLLTNTEQYSVHTLCGVAFLEYEFHNATKSKDNYIFILSLSSLTDKWRIYT